MSGYLRLGLSFDSAPLQAELEQMLASEWLDHYNTTVYAGGWQCIPLRSVDGRLDHIMASDSEAYAPTVILQRCPHFQQVLAAFECELRSVRLMALAPGARIAPHRDPGTGYADGVARLHVPILTAPEVLFHIDGESVHFSQGDTWYLNANCLHGVDNDSAVNRVHLAIDCVPNAWLDALFAPALGQRLAASDSALVIKLDGWHIHSLASIRRAFPDTPCWFLYREPNAVRASHRRRRGPQMVPGMIAPQRLGIDRANLAPGDLDGYCISVLENMFASALAQAGEHGLILLNYNQLPAAIVPDLLAHMAIRYSAQDSAAIGQRAGFHSKDGGAAYGGDPAGGADAGATLAAAYAQLEQRRLAAAPGDAHVR